MPCIPISGINVYDETDASIFRLGIECPHYGGNRFYLPDIFT
jgi:hypothetical protein